jgi:cathepsin E
MVMLLVTALVSFVVLATRVTAGRSNHHPHTHSLSITKHIDLQAKYYPVQRDRRRFTHLMNKANPVNSMTLVESSKTADLGSPLNNIGPCYVAEIGIGVPPTYCKSCVDFFCWDILFYMGHLDDLIVDTGSSNTWVGAKAPYVKTKTSVNTYKSVVSIALIPGSLDQLKPKTYGLGREIRHRFFRR